MRDTLVGDLVILRVAAAETLRRDLLELLSGVHRRRMRRPRHRVCRLAAAGHAGERKVLRRIAPYDIALLPRHTQNFRACTMDVDHRLRSEVTDPRVESNPAIGRDEDKPVKADSAADVTTK